MASLGEKQARLVGLVQLENLDILEELNEACLRRNLCTGSHCLLVNLLTCQPPYFPNTISAFLASSSLLSLFALSSYSAVVNFTSLSSSCMA